MVYWCLTSASKPLICRESWCRLSVEAVVLQHTLKSTSLCAMGMLEGGGGGGGYGREGERARGKGTMLLVLHFSTLTEHTLYKACFLAQQDIVVHTLPVILYLCLVKTVTTPPHLFDTHSD